MEYSRHFTKPNMLDLSLEHVAAIFVSFTIVFWILYTYFGKPDPTWPEDRAVISKRIFIAASDPDSVQTARWQRFHPTWTVRLYTLKDCRTSIADLGDWTVALFDQLPPNEQLDFWRVCIVFLYGGVAVDAKSEPTACFENAVSPNATFAAALEPLLIAATPFNPILEHVIDYYHSRRHQLLFYSQPHILNTALDNALLPLLILDHSFQNVHRFGQKVTILQTKNSFPKPYFWASADLKHQWRKAITLCNRTGDNLIFRD